MVNSKIKNCLKTWYLSVIALIGSMPFLVTPVEGLEIVGFGDSITKGTPYVEEREGDGRRIGGYEPELEALLGEEGQPSAVYNWGIGGEHTSSGVFRIDDVIRNYEYLDYILIMEGTNDIGNLSFSSTMFNLARMLDRARKLNVEPIIATLTPDTKNDRKKDYIQTLYNPKIREMAATSQVILADQYNATIDNWPGLNYDGVHPNRSGYRVLAQTWRDAILSEGSNLRPEVVTLQASQVGDDSAILNGTVNPNNSDTSYRFEFGPTTDYDSTTSAFDAGSGTTSISVSVTINSLNKNTPYHYRIVATNSSGSSFGHDSTFTTGADSSPVNTLDATNVSTNSARLNGSINPEGIQSDYFFEYGTDSNYGNVTTTRSVGSGSEHVDVGEDINGLLNNTTYQYRVVSIRGEDTIAGGNVTFTTGSNGNGSSGGCFIDTLFN